MKNISKSAIAPIVTAIFLAISYLSGHKFDASFQDNVSIIATALFSLGIMIWGIFKDHSKPAVNTVPAEIRVVANKVAETAKAVETAAQAIEAPVQKAETTPLGEPVQQPAVSPTPVAQTVEGDVK